MWCILTGEYESSSTSCSLVFWGDIGEGCWRGVGLPDELKFFRVECLNTFFDAEYSQWRLASLQFAQVGYDSSHYLIRVSKIIFNLYCTVAVAKGADMPWHDVACIQCNRFLTLYELFEAWLEGFLGFGWNMKAFESKQNSYMDVGLSGNLKKNVVRAYDWIRNPLCLV